MAATVKCRASTPRKTAFRANIDDLKGVIRVSIPMNSVTPKPESWIAMEVSNEFYTSRVRTRPSDGGNSKKEFKLFTLDVTDKDYEIEDFLSSNFK